MNRDQLLNLTLTDLSFKELLALFKRRKWVVIGTILVFLALGAVYTAVTPATYRAATQVIVEGKTQVNPGMGNNIVGTITQSGLDYDVMTQIQIMGSFNILYSGLKRINYKMPDRITQDVYEKFPKVSVLQVQTTNTVQVAVEHTNDDQAAALAEAIPIAYAEYVEGIQKDDVKRSYEFVSARIEEEKKNQATLQQELANYRMENSVTDSKTESEVRASALSEARRKLSEAESDVPVTEAALRQAQANLEAAPKTILNDVVNNRNETLGRNEEILNGLIQQRAAAIVTNLEDSDRVKRIDAQIKQQETVLSEIKSNSKINAPITVRNPALDDLERTVNQYKTNRDGAIARLESMKKLVEQKQLDLKNLAPLTAAQQMKEIKINEVETTISNLLAIQNSIRLRDNSLPKPIRDLTGKPTAILVRPLLPVNLGLAAFVGLIFGTIFALARDLVLDRVNSSNEACMIADKEILGRIPLRASGRNALIADPQKARAFESYRILRSSLLLAKGESKAFLVTSSVSKEGKSTVAANLAVALALDGKRTVLVDGNLRNPSVHKLFKVDLAKGVSDVLTGTVSLNEALKTTDTPNLAILTAGQDAPNPTELVASESMKTMIESLKGDADIVIVDAASAFGYADTQSLLSAIPDVLYVVEIESPTKSQMREAIGMIDFAGGKLTGVVINKDRWAETRTRGAS